MRMQLSVANCITGNGCVPVIQTSALCRHPRKAPSVLPMKNFLNRLNQIITEHLDNEQLGIPFICKQNRNQQSSLYNKLKALTDMGANDYITKIRMERAIWLILHTELSVNDIADKTGFSTARYFSTVFKQHTGCSPTQYREKPPVNTQ